MVKKFCDLCNREQKDGLLYEMEISITPDSGRGFKVMGLMGAFREQMERSIFRSPVCEDDDYDDEKPKGLEYSKSVCRSCAAKVALRVGTFLEQMEMERN